MYEAKTKPTKASVDEFIGNIPDENQRKDCRVLKKIMSEISGDKAKMWGPSIVGFGRYHYKYQSGHEGEACRIGFSPRKQNTTVYLAPEVLADEEAVQRVGKVKTSKACLYIKRLADIDMNALSVLIKKSLDSTAERYGDS